MAASLLNRIYVAITRIEHSIAYTFGRTIPPDAFCVDFVQNVETLPKQTKAFSIKDILGDGFLWAVPKHRRSLEKRWKRRFGAIEGHWKMMEPSQRLRTCNVCGDDHEIGVLCPSCYKKVMDETKLMQDKIQSELKLEPVENEVVVLYDSEKDDKPSEYWQGKRIIEMEKARPSWFSKNLTQTTTQQPATTSDVKPSQLG